MFYNFTSATPDLPSGDGFSLFQLKARLEHGGDYAAAAKTLAADGWGRQQGQKAPQQDEDVSKPPWRTYTACELVAAHLTYRPAIIDGWLRQGETMNVIAAPKTGKSWLVLQLAFSIAQGVPFLGRECRKHPVLIIDNELHPETAAQRMRSVGSELGLPVDDGITVVPLRGQLEDIVAITDRLVDAARRVGAGVIILDALYRLLPKDTNESDNAAIMQVYNLLDRIAAQTGAAIILVHHTSKGNQGEKSVTDVGSGAGTFSRAPDCHLTLREHEEQGHVVVDAVARSWSPPGSLVIRRSGLVWEVADGADATRVKGRRNGSQPDELDTEDLVARFVPEVPVSTQAIHASIGEAGLTVGVSRVKGLLELAASAGDIVCEKRAHGALFYGRTASPDAETGTQERRAIDYMREHPNAARAEVAAAVGCSDKTVQRARGKLAAERRASGEKHDGQAGGQRGGQAGGQPNCPQDRTSSRAPLWGARGCPVPDDEAEKSSEHVPSPKRRRREVA